MGNILKFDFSKTDMLEETDKNRVEELQAMKEAYIHKYGSDPDAATLGIDPPPVYWTKCLR